MGIGVAAGNPGSPRQNTPLVVPAGLNAPVGAPLVVPIGLGAPVGSPLVVPTSIGSGIPSGPVPNVPTSVSSTGSPVGVPKEPGHDRRAPDVGVPEQADQHRQLPDVGVPVT